MNPAESPLTCREMVARLEDYVDRYLDPDELRRVEEHLGHCIACAAEYHFEVGILNGIRERLQRISLPPDLLSSIRARLDTERGTFPERPAF
jgi:predicted anti-sigma-YlaC factor YlaD